MKPLYLRLLLLLIGITSLVLIWAFEVQGVGVINILLVVAYLGWTEKAQEA